MLFCCSSPWKVPNGATMVYRSGSVLAYYRGRLSSAENYCSYSFLLFRFLFPSLPFPLPHFLSFLPVLPFPLSCLPPLLPFPTFPLFHSFSLLFPSRFSSRPIPLPFPFHTVTFRFISILPRHVMLARYLLSLCVRLSARLPVTRRYCIKRLDESSWLLAWSFYPPIPHCVGGKFGISKN